MNKVQKFVLIGFTMVITSIILLTIGNYASAIEYSNYMNNKYGIKFDYPNVIYLDSISLSTKDNNIIIPITAEFKNSNQYKINSCAQSYHNMIPKIHRDDESYWEGSIVVCTYGLYNYNANIGNKNMDPFLQIQIEGEAQLCMLDDHCMKKINQIIKGKIALPSTPSTPTLKDSSRNISPPQTEIPRKFSPQEEEQQLVDLCAQVLLDKRQSPLCQDLTPDVKQKVQIEAQKLGVSVQKVENSTQNSPSTPNQNQPNEEELIPVCAMNLYLGNQLPDCEKLSPNAKIEVQLWAKKMGENVDVDTPSEKNNGEDEDDDKDEYDDKDDKKKKK
jgi:hypothetical protein